MTDPTVEARVAAGAALLDQHVPGWETRINLETLELSDGEDCILGQIGHAAMEEETVTEEQREWREWYTPYTVLSGSAPGACVLWPKATEFFQGLTAELKPKFGEDRAVWAYGFSITDNFSRNEYWEDLEAAWVTLIKARFEMGAVI